MSDGRACCDCKRVSVDFVWRASAWLASGGVFLQSHPAMTTNKGNPMGLILAVIVLIGSLVFQAPAIAMTSHPANAPFAANIKSKDLSASAKQVEGRLQAAHGELMGDPGETIKGQAKQVQAAAMQAGSDLKQGVKSAADSLADSAAKAADKIK